MSRNLVLPFFPIPPEEYDQQYMTEVMRAFSVYLTQMQNPGDVRATTITATELPTSDYGLETGAFFQRNGFVKVVLNYQTNPNGVTGTGQVGSVTVTTG